VAAYRTSKVGEAFYSVFTVFDYDLITPVSGQSPSNFTVRFSFNNAVIGSPPFTISEIGASGDYVISVAGGLPSKGLWAVSVEVEYNGSTWRDEVEVRDHDIDDIYDIIIAGGSGLETVKLTVIDTSNGNALVPDALLQVYDDTGTVLVTFQRTDASGEALVLLDADTYEVRVFKPGTSALPQSIVVIDTGGATQQDFSIEVESILVVPPASPNLCRLFGDFIEFDGTPIENFKISIENRFDPEAEGGLTMVSRVKEFLTNASGHVEFDVVRGARIRVAFVNTSLVRDIVVPDKPVENLATAYGLATDNFQVVKK
jgi:hypothetical protein